MISLVLDDAVQKAIRYSILFCKKKNTYTYSIYNHYISAIFEMNSESNNHYISAIFEMNSEVASS